MKYTNKNNIKQIKKIFKKTIAFFTSLGRYCERVNCKVFFIERQKHLNSVFPV